MPRSKRHKVVSLTKTDSKGREGKNKNIELVRKCLDEYQNLFAFTYENMRTAAFKEVRMHFKESRLYLGKNKVTQVALGKRSSDEFGQDLHKVSSKLVGDAGLFFTNRGKEEVQNYFNNFTFMDYAKAGFIPEQDIIIPVGPTNFPVDMIEQLRKLGLILEVDNGVLVLKKKFVAAKAGEPLTPEQGKALVHFDYKICPFSLSLECFWSNGAFIDLS
jgi:mRNA turnover protein 4